MDWTCIYELCPLSGASWIPVMGEEENEREWGGGCDEMRWTEGKRTLANQLYIHIFIFLHFLKLFYKRLKNYINLFKWLIFGKLQKISLLYLIFSRNDILSPNDKNNWQSTMKIIKLINTSPPN